MFEWLWDRAKNKQGKVICPYSGVDISALEHGSVEAWVCAFAHILCKKNYPYWKLNPANVIVVSPDFHKIIDAGTYADKAKHPDWKWEKWDVEVIKMKVEYAKFKKENLLA
jgi:hypothetical protein